MVNKPEEKTTIRMLCNNENNIRFNSDEKDKLMGEFEERMKIIFDKFNERYPETVYYLAEFEMMVNEAKQKFPKCEDCKYLENTFKKSIDVPLVKESNNGCIFHLKGIIKHCPKNKWVVRWFK